MLLPNACKNHKKYVRKTDENGPKMVPKPLQNRSWRGSGGHLGAILETRCFQDLIFDDFGSILGPPLGPVWVIWGIIFFNVFLKWLFDGLGLHFGSQNTSKMRPKSGPKPKPGPKMGQTVGFPCFFLWYGPPRHCRRSSIHAPRLRRTKREPFACALGKNDPPRRWSVI